MTPSLRFNEWLYHKILVIRTNIHLGQLNFKLIHFFEGAFTKYTASARQPNKLQACYKWTCFSGADLRIICLILYWDLCGWSTINNPNMRESNMQPCDLEVGQIMSPKSTSIMSNIWKNNVYFQKKMSKKARNRDITWFATKEQIWFILTHFWQIDPSLPNVYPIYPINPICPNFELI